MQPFSYSERLMGTTITLRLFHPQGPELLQACFDYLRDFEARFSANDAQSQLMHVNQAAGFHPIEVDPDLFGLIQIGLVHGQAQPSNLNIAIGPLVQTWRIGFEDANRPADDLIQEQLKRIDPNKILLDPDAHTVYLKEAGMKIDLGALAKGYAADHVARFLQGHGVQSALIDLGGNVLTIGDNASSASPWKIGIQDPQKPRGNYLLAVKLTNQSLVTSGIYERQLVIGDQHFHHIFDSQTGYPTKTNLASISILSPTSLEGEIWTTRLFGQDPRSILSQVEQLPGIEVFLVDTEGRVAYSSGFPNYFLHN